MPKRKAKPQDWHEVLRGISLAELEAHPERYRKEPYCTALKRAAEESAAAVREGVRQFHAVIDPVEPELHAAIDVFIELTPDEAADAIRRMRSARAKQTGHHNTGKRRSRYEGKFQDWRKYAAVELALHPDADAKELAMAVKAKTPTEAATRYLVGWINRNMPDIERLATACRKRRERV